ncbi:efflux RND transporter periplasmic adaptor subunit [Myxococcota bacterium]|nr:efflux RND transporter periplasmic adaptor subunit [Myxococcota bacterium]
MKTPSHHILLSLAASLLLGAASAGCGADPAASLPTAQVVRGPFEVSLTITGELKAVKSVKIVAPGLRGSNKIVELAAAGSMVKKGDVICRFDTTEAERELQTTTAELALAEQRVVQKQLEIENNLKNLERGVVQAQLALDQARLGLTESETVSRIEKERTRIDVVRAEMDLARAQQDLAAARATGAGDVEQLRLEVRKQRDQKAELEESLSKSVMSAPTDGLVIPGKTWRGGTVAEGDEVWGGVTIMELPDLSAMEVKGYVHEVDAALVAAGQEAEVRLDSFPDRAFAGKVKKIADLASERSEGGKVKYFEVTVELATTDPVMKPGMTAKIDLRVERVPDALSVPREAVQDGPEGPVVWVETGGRPEARPVELGKRNATHVAVTGGVSAGERVFLGDPTAAPGEEGGGSKPAPAPGGGGGGGAKEGGGGKGGGKRGAGAPS